MDRLLIEGGRPLRGTIAASGSKNATLPLMAAACLAETPSTIYNAPGLSDVETMLRVLMHVGCGVKRLPGQITLQPDTFGCYEIPWDIVRKMRASVYMLGPMLARHGKAKIALPGGCAIGTRPIDLHLKGMEALGAKIEVKHGCVTATAPRLRGARFDLTGPAGSSVGATANCLMAATMATGTTIIMGAAREPEIVCLVDFLTAMGAKIDGAGTSTLVIDGTQNLYGVRYTAAPDRIEAATYMAAVVATRGEALVSGVKLADLSGIADVMAACGAVIEEHEEGLAVSAGDLKPIDVTTLPHPGFPTDMQAQIMAMLTVAPGSSLVRDTIYPKRFIHVAELNRMGANIVEGLGEATVHGVKSLSGAEVMASDLRASAALVIAGLMAEGETVINRLYHIDRGYEKIEDKLTMLGARVERLGEMNPGRGVVSIENLREEETGMPVERSAEKIDRRADEARAREDVAASNGRGRYAAE